MLKKSLPIVVGAAVVLGCVGLGANAAYGTGGPGLEHAQSHTTVLWAYPAYPDLTKPQPYVDSVRGADIHAFDEYVKQAGLCGQTFQVDVYKTVVKGERVESLWSKGYLEYAHDGAFLAYGLGYTPYKVLTGKDTECTQPPAPTPTPTPPATPEPTPTDTPTLPPVSTPTPEPTEPPEPTSTPTPSGEPTEPVTPTPTTPTEPEPTSTPTAPESPSPTSTPEPTPTPGSTGSATPTPVPSTEPTASPTPSGSTTVSATSSPTPPSSIKTGSGTTPTLPSTDDTARTLAYTGISVVGPIIAAVVLAALGGITLWVRHRRKNLGNN